MDQPNPYRAQSDPELLAPLRATPVFAGLPKAVVAALCRRMTRQRPGAGQTLFEKDALGDVLYKVTPMSRPLHQPGTECVRNECVVEMPLDCNFELQR